MLSLFLTRDLIHGPSAIVLLTRGYGPGACGVGTATHPIVPIVALALAASALHVGPTDNAAKGEHMTVSVNACQGEIALAVGAGKVTGEVEIRT